MAVEFRQFVEEQHAVVGKADFAGSGRRTTADQAGVADGVMGRTKRAAGEQRFARAEPADGTVNPRGLDRFFRGELWQDRRHAFGEHGLATAGRAEHQQVVPACRGNGDGTLGHFLTTHVGKVDVVFAMLGKQVADATWLRRDINRPAEKPNRLCQAVDGDDLQALHHGRFAGVLRGEHQPAHAFDFRRRHGHGERPFHRPHAAIEGQLADDGILAQPIGL